MSSVPYNIVVLLLLQALICHQQEKCAVLEFYHLEQNNLWVLENHFANVTFGINDLGCNHTNTLYKVTVLTRTRNGSLEYDGTITFLSDICAGTNLTSVRCISPTGPAELYRKFNRSHVEIRLEWVWKNTLFNNFTTKQKDLKLTVAYPPSVTGLTVSGHAVNSSHLIVEGQTVNISCSFDKGIPPASFRLLDEHGREIKTRRDEKHLNGTITAQCYQDWASVRCEANSSEKNRSVSFLATCPPQFIDKSPKFIDMETQELWLFRIKAHSTAIQKCLLAPSTVGENKNKEVNCTLTGSPPNLLLTLSVDKDECSKSGHWALTLFSEKGSSDMLVFSTPRLVLQFYYLEDDLLSIMEDHHINVTFGMNMSACNQSSQLYKVTVLTSTNNGSLEYDGSITFSKDECSGTRQKSVHCITSSGPAQLYKRVNRSHELIVWEWLWKDYNFSTMRKELKLIVAYPPSVKSLTVNGQDADDSYILEKGQKVEISCLFDQGNPPSNVRLSDEHGKEIKSYRGEQYLNTSFTANCDQHPSSVRCEGNSSENSKSVFFLVKCRPQFIDKAPEVIDYESHEGWKFRVKAYSTNIHKCLLASSVVCENKNKEVNCTLTGSPPSLVLTIVVDKEECSQSGHWALTVFNEKGSSDMLVFSVSSRNCLSILLIYNTETQKTTLPVRTAHETVLSITVVVYMQSLHDVDKSEEERLSNNDSTNALGGKDWPVTVEKPDRPEPFSVPVFSA